MNGASMLAPVSAGAQLPQRISEDIIANSGVKALMAARDNDQELTAVRRPVGHRVRLTAGWETSPPEFAAGFAVERTQVLVL